MLTKLIGGTLMVVIASSAVVFGIQDPQPTQKTPSKFMARKLDSSREIVGGLATENYDLISKSAQDLMLLSHDAEWKVIQGQQYLQMSSEFRSSAERLRDVANNKNLDGATLAYFEVTMNCVRCHKYVRTKQSGLNRPGK